MEFSSSQRLKEDQTCHLKMLEPPLSQVEKVATLSGSLENSGTASQQPLICSGFRTASPMRKSYRTVFNHYIYLNGKRRPCPCSI